MRVGVAVLAAVVVVAVPATANAMTVRVAKAATKTVSTHLTLGEARDVARRAVKGVNDLFITNTQSVRCKRTRDNVAACRVTLDGRQRLVLRVKVTEAPAYYDARARVVSIGR